MLTSDVVKVEQPPYGCSKSLNIVIYLKCE